MNVLYAIAAIAVVTALILFIRKRKAGDTIDFHGVPIPRSFPYSTFTSAGVGVRSVVPIPSYVQNWIDEGIEQQIAAVTRIRPWIARSKPEWMNGRDPANYTVLIIEPMGTYTGSVPTMQGAPVLFVEGIQASATNTGTGGNRGEIAIVVPHQAGQDWRYDLLFRNAVRFESEHIVMWGNDQGMFYEFVGPGRDLHPVFPNEDGS